MNLVQALVEFILLYIYIAFHKIQNAFTHINSHPIESRYDRLDFTDEGHLKGLRITQPRSDMGWP